MEDIVQGLRETCARFEGCLHCACSLCACIWKTCARFEGCLFTVHVYGRLVQSLRDACLLWMYMKHLCKV